MNAIEKGLFSLLVVVPLVGCTSVPILKLATSRFIPGEATPNLPASGESSPAATPATPTQKVDRRNTETITIYAADAQCESLISQQIEVPENKMLDASVGETLDRWNGHDFKLAGYRVSLEAQTGVATVDLRVAPDSERAIVSLSSCERYALFGSLSETLTSNPQWQISEVRFTDRGEEIIF